MTIKHVFPAGKYYVGDPCYAVKDENWNALCDQTHTFGNEDKEISPTDYNWTGLFRYNDKDCFTDDTKYGDGSFYDNYGHEFGVDAGLIGIMPLEVCDGDSMEGGQIIEFTLDFEVWAEDGDFHFGNVVIQTGDTEEDDEWKEFEEDDPDEDEDFEDDSEEDLDEDWE
jgi:hypothetical protein